MYVGILVLNFLNIIFMLKLCMQLHFIWHFLSLLAMINSYRLVLDYKFL